MEDMTSSKSIRDFFKNRNVLITGATGFVGKVLTEKLLRSCPDIGTIYVLVRPKWNQSDPRRRVDEFLQSALFDKLKQEQPDALKKVIAVNGDITLTQLGLDERDEDELIEKVSVVFHSAATVRMDEPLNKATDFNLRGTQRLIALCQKMINLAALVHVSTAYCNCNREEIDEVVYPMDVNPNQIIDTMSWMSDAAIEAVTPKLLGNYPNTYVYTKALAEILVAESEGIPRAIVRPSIVVASWKAPMPGWIDSISGITGVVVMGGKGLLRSALCDMNKIIDAMPVDVCVNLMIAAAWHTATQKSNEVRVYNCTSGSINKTTWGEVLNIGLQAVLKNPFHGLVWYPSGGPQTNKYKHAVYDFFFHYTTAAIADGIATLAGRKRMYLRVYNKFRSTLETVQYFSQREWTFSNANFWKLWEAVPEEDKEEFNFDFRSLHWPTFVDNYCLGVRKYFLKEDVSTIPAARQKLRKLRLLHYFLKSTSICIMSHFLYSTFLKDWISAFIESDISTVGNMTDLYMCAM